MKNKIDVIKYRYITLIPSILILLIGLVFLFTSGFNMGIDFEAGLSERVQIAPVGVSVRYSGDASSAILSVEGGDLRVTLRDSDGASVTLFQSDYYPTVSDVAEGLSAFEGMEVEVIDGSLLTENLVTGFGFPATLGSTPVRLNFATVGRDVLIEDIRSALSPLDGVNVQVVGDAEEGIFQIRVKSGEEEGSGNVEGRVRELLSEAFGAEEVVILQSDFVGPRFSSSLLSSSLKAVLIAVLLILIYIWVRFRFAYAISAILALLHDVLMMLSFILIFRIEVSSTTVAAVLTIIGYSLNNTIVIFDRVRENIPLMKGVKVDAIINLSVGQSLTRTIITTLTTLFAIVPLAIFSDGTIQLFAINLTWGLIVGAWSSNCITTSFLHWFDKIDPIDVVKKKETNQDIHIGDAYV